MRRLGRNWQRLHRLVYAIAILGVIHYLWLVKADWAEPALYGLVLGIMLALRLPWVGHFLARRRALSVSRRTVSD
jgi:sulfoxide reductase heme-binding subunit YedZ